MIAAAELKENDLVLEIGAGLGTLTKEIAAKAGKVIAVEIDKQLIRVLNDQLRNYRNIEVVQGSILDPKCCNVKMLQGCNGFKIVANLPFNITGLVLKRFLSQELRPSLAVLILQKEVGERIIAQPPKMSLLAVAVQSCARPEIISQADKSGFWPQPGVDSVIMKIVFPSPAQGRLTQDSESDLKEIFFQVVRAGFSSPRKYLVNNFFKRGLIMENKKKIAKIFEQMGLNPKTRAQELSIEKWIELAEKIKNLNKNG